MVSKISLLKQPSAWLPIALSLTVLAIMLISFAIFGIPHRQADEGTAAHFFQIWLVLEMMIIAFFAIKYLAKKPKQAVQVLALQIVAALAACVPVFLLKL